MSYAISEAKVSLHPELFNLNLKLAIQFEVKPASALTTVEVQTMAELFSGHYGAWGIGGPSPGGRVRLSAAKLRADYLAQSCFATLATRKEDGALLGHAIFHMFPFDGGIGMWISQLVVHSHCRGQKIASRMIGTAVATPHNVRACGMATSHPHAVRAMEKAVGARCSPAVIAEVAPAFLAASGVSYVQGKEIRISPGSTPPRCTIDTAFFVGHDEVNALRADLVDWQLGPLEDGEEFLAVAVRPL